MAAPDPIRDQPFERALPNSAEAERAILGAILLDNGLISQAIEQLRAFSPLVQRCWSTGHVRCRGAYGTAKYGKRAAQSNAARFI